MRRRTAQLAQKSRLSYAFGFDLELRVHIPDFITADRRRAGIELVLCQHCSFVPQRRPPQQRLKCLFIPGRTRRRFWSWEDARGRNLTVSVRRCEGARDAIRGMKHCSLLHACTCCLLASCASKVFVIGPFDIVARQVTRSCMPFPPADVSPGRDACSQTPTTFD